MHPKEVDQILTRARSLLTPTWREGRHNQAMRKLLIAGGILLALLAWLGPGRTRSLDLEWLPGSWHTGDDANVRLLWSRPDAHGIEGMLMDGRQTTLLSLDNRGTLVARSFGPSLQDAGPPQQFTLLEEQPQQLRFNHHTTLTHLSGRSQASELKLELQGKSWTFQRD